MPYEDQQDPFGALNSRLDSIARTVALTPDYLRAGISVTRMVLDVLLVCGGLDVGIATVSGPDIQLSWAVGETFWLVIHELAMNSVLHGVLGAARGRLAINWRLNIKHGTVMHFEWLETGHDVAGVPAKHGGYGAELINVILPRETGASTSLQVGARGSRCTIDLPLSQGASLNVGD